MPGAGVVHHIIRVVPAMSAVSPLCPAKPTLSVKPTMSEKCQKQTLGPDHGTFAFYPEADVPLKRRLPKRYRLQNIRPRLRHLDRGLKPPSDKDDGAENR
jgi:hypothetical protein